MTCLRFYVLYIISVSSRRRDGDNGKQRAMISCLQSKRFPSPASVGNRGRDGLIIKPLPPISYRAYRETKRQSDSQPARQTDNQRERERERDRDRERDRERDEYSLLSLQQLHC